MVIPESIKASLVSSLTARLGELEQEMAEIRTWLADNTTSTGPGAVTGKPVPSVDEARRLATSKRMKKFWARKRKEKKEQEAAKVQEHGSGPLDEPMPEPTPEELKILAGVKG